MNEINFQKLSKIISEQKDDDSIKSYIIQILQNLLDFENYNKKKFFWFEEQIFQQDKEYVYLIYLYIDIFIKYLETNDFNETEFHKEITNAAQNSKYSNIYKLIRTIFLKLDNNDEKYYEIYWCIYFLGFKKNSPLNETFISNLKEIASFPQIKDSFYKEQISQLNYDKIDEYFLDLINKLIDSIILNKKKNSQSDKIIANLNSKDSSKDENNNDSKMKKFEINDNDNDISKSKAQNIINDQIENTRINLDTNQIKDKQNEIELENDSSTKTNELLNNSFEKFNNFKNGENDLIKNIQNLVFVISQDHQRYYAIIHMRTLIKKKLEEYKNSIIIEKKFIEKNYQLNENFIKINRLKAAVKLLNPSNIVNLKRKVIDIAIFLLFKNGKDDFKLNDQYCPNSKFLKSALKKLNEIKGKDIQNKVNFINDLLNKDITTISYPLTINNKDLKSLVSFLNFYKSKFTNIVHIGHESTNYYLLPIKSKKFPYLPTISLENKDVEEQESNKRINYSLYGEKIKFDFEQILELIIKDSFNIDEIDFEKNMNKLNDEKNQIYEYCDILSNFMKNDIINDDDEISFKNRDKIFTNEEILFCNSILCEFQDKIKNLENEIVNLLKDDKDLKKLFINIDNFQNKFNETLKKELKFNIDDNYNPLNMNNGNNLLYYKYKYDKLNILYIFIKNLIQIFNQNIQSKTEQIIEKINTIKKETDDMNKIINKITYLKPISEIFKEWKFKKQCYNNNFESFVNILKNSIKTNFKVSIDNDFIYDQLISTWMIKNDIDDLLVS